MGFHKLPIYMSNISVEIVKKSGRITKVTRLSSRKNVLVKGFTIEDIIARKQKTLRNLFDLKSEEFFGKIDVTLLKQHGYGVDD